MKKTYILAGLGVGFLALTATTVVFAANGNYSAWRASMGGRGSQAVTEQNFESFTNMHRLIGEGKYDEAQKIRTDIGLGQVSGGGAGGCGMHSASAGQGSGVCGKSGGGDKANFLDENKNGTCDNAEQAIK